jgi:hypothetical protein
VCVQAAVESFTNVILQAMDLAIPPGILRNVKIPSLVFSHTDLLHPEKELFL